MPNENLVTTIEVTDEEGNVSTRDIVTYAGLLSKAHEQGLQRIETRIEQMPTEENGMTAICTATVTTGRGVFMDCGDANPHNVRSGAVPHIIRVALTRAKGRALRDAVNIGTISLEELAEYSLDLRADSSPKGSREPQHPRLITEPQRKRLVDLVERQGKTGKEAERHLCRELGVDQLSNATLSAASTLIRKLTAEPATNPDILKRERSNAS